MADSSLWHFKPKIGTSSDNGISCTECHWTSDQNNWLILVIVLHPVPWLRILETKVTRERDIQYVLLYLETIAIPSYSIILNTNNDWISMECLRNGQKNNHCFMCQATWEGLCLLRDKNFQDNLFSLNVNRSNKCMNLELHLHKLYPYLF